ncbi:uncharacterized protein LOC121871620, partial [Homarus americanus]|uniref:uncharacterized protein LOC121871620 n=1 Tax=Homarus americanus TaxID=6706 RepID=UPI001C48202B
MLSTLENDDLTLGVETTAADTHDELTISLRSVMNLTTDLTKDEDGEASMKNDEARMKDDGDRMKDENVEARMKDGNVEAGMKDEDVEAGMKDEDVEARMKDGNVEAGMKDEDVEARMKDEDDEARMTDADVEARMKEEDEIKNDLSKVTSLEELLQIVAPHGRWHFFIITLCAFNGFVGPWSAMTYQFLGATPDYWCLVAPLVEANWTQEQIFNLAIPT